MKLNKVFIIVLAIFIGACSKHDKQMLLIDQVDLAVGVLEDENRRLMEQFDYALNRVGFGDPEKIMAIYNAALQVRKASDEVKGVVKLFGDNYYSTSMKGITKGKKDQPSEELGLREIHRNFEDKVTEFNDIVNYTVCNLLTWDHSIPEPIIIPTEIMQIFNVSEKEVSKVKDVIKLALSELNLNVLSTEYSLLSELMNHIDGAPFFRHRLDVIVEPESEIVRAGSNYTATIYTGFINQPDDYFTPNDYQLTIEGKKYSTTNGNFIYRELVPSEKGSYIRNGKFIIPFMDRGDTLAVPFRLTFVVD
jgi:hypothetical protein